MQVVGGAATVWVLPWNAEMIGTGTRNPAHGEGASSGQSSSDAIVVVIGKNDVILNVLHADASSAGRGQSYLAAVNGNVVPGSDQARAACSLVPAVVSVSC